MLTKRIVPGNLIGANDAARMIVRGALIAAPSDMRKKYESFVSPLSMGTSDYGINGNISFQVKKIFDDLVEDLKKLQFEESKIFTLDEIKYQRDAVVEAANRYIEILKKSKDKGAKTIGDQLAVITENISTRTVVLNYPNADKQRSSFGTFDESISPPLAGRKYSVFTLDEPSTSKFDNDNDFEFKKNKL